MATSSMFGRKPLRTSLELIRQKLLYFYINTAKLSSITD